MANSTKKIKKHSKKFGGNKKSAYLCNAFEGKPRQAGLNPRNNAALKARRFASSAGRAQHF